MSIVYAEIEKGSLSVYDEKGKRLFSKSMGKDAEMVGITSYPSVIIKKGNTIYSYGKKGEQLFSKYLGGNDKVVSIDGANILIKKGST